MKKIFNAVMLLAVALSAGALPCAAGSAQLNFTVENASGYGPGFNPLYRVSGSGVNLQVQNNSFENDPFAKYSVTGSLFGRQLGFNDSIQNDNFGGTAGVIVDAAGIYAKFSRQAGWPELRVDTRVDGADPRSVVLFAVLANYLPVIPGASSSGAYQPTQSYSLRQFGDSVLADGAGLAGVRVEHQGFLYTVRGSAFGKNFDGADRLTLELDNTFLGSGGVRVNGCGMNLVIRRDDFGGPRLNVSGAAGDSPQLAAFTLALARYLNSAI